MASRPNIPENIRRWERESSDCYQEINDLIEELSNKVVRYSKLNEKILDAAEEEIEYVNNNMDNITKTRRLNLNETKSTAKSVLRHTEKIMNIIDKLNTII